MKKSEIENLIYKSSGNFVPDRYDKIIKSNRELFPGGKLSKERQTERRVRPNPRKRFLVAASLIICILAASLLTFFYTETEDNYIYLDINPSVEIVTKRNGRVKAVSALNDDAAGLIDFNFSNKSIDEVTEEIIDRAVDLGFIVEGDSEIYVSIYGDNQARKEAALKKVYNKIDSHLSKKGIAAGINKQDLTKEEKEAARSLDISAGKLKVIEQIIELDETQTVEGLKDKSMKELKEIYKSLKGKK